MQEHGIRADDRLLTLHGVHNDHDDDDHDDDPQADPAPSHARSVRQSGKQLRRGWRNRHLDSTFTHSIPPGQLKNKD